ncbi:MAG: TetR/AcrR family transcriptional regulator [Clostridia bacterium]|nr:TetR/AcrR family transcriptional regulator [Clostridia bacterium]
MSVKDATHEYIADTAYHILCNKPITKFTMTELAEACRISKPTLYHHFKDKFEVAQYICKRFSDEFYSEHTLSDILNGKSAETQFYIIRYQNYFRNVLCYDGQNNIFDYLAEIELHECLREAKEILGTEQLSEDLLASAEYYAYSVWHAMYAMLVGKIPQRYLSANRPAMSMYWPPLLTEVFRQEPNQR